MSRARRVVVGAVLAGCAGRATAPPVAAVHDGISIALYASPPGAGGPGRAYALIDDRRWIDVHGGSIVLDRIAPDAALESLVIEAPIEPRAGGRLELGSCLRERIGFAPADREAAEPTPTPVFAPTLRCAVRAGRGRYLVRVLYVSRALGYRAQHDVAITAPDRATVASRFAIVTPAWHARATVTIFAGVPGTDHPPRELTRGPVMLDGATAVLAVAPRALPAELRWIYDGALPGADDSSPRDRAWHRASHPAVWVWLELHDAPAGGLLASAAAHVHVELPGEPVRDVDVPAAAQRRASTGLGLPLWIDPQLHGRRDRVTSSPEDGALSDSFSLSVANTGPVAREIWIEEQLRPTRRHAVVRAWPGEPTLIQHLLRLKLAVPPGKLERAGFELHYEL